MALIRCPDCGRDVSDAATHCPHCGRPLAAAAPPAPAHPPATLLERVGCLYPAIALIIVLLLVIVFWR